MTCSKEIIKFSNFQTKKFVGYPPQKCSNLNIYHSELILPNSGMGKDWADFPFTHSKNHLELRTYSFCFLNRLTIYNKILLHPLHFCSVLGVVEL